MPVLQAPPRQRRAGFRMIDPQSAQGSQRAPVADWSVDRPAGGPTGVDTDTAPGPTAEATSEANGQAAAPAGLAPPAVGDIGMDVVHRAAAGDDGAFATLVEHYDPMLRELAFHLLGDRVGMERVLYRAYVQAYRGLPRITPDTRPGPWLYRIAYLACLDELRRRHRQPRRRATDRLVGTEWQDAATSALDRALAILPADQRAALLMVERAGFELDAVSEVLDWPGPVVVRAVTCAQALLRSALDVDAASAPQPPDELPFPGPQ